MHIARVYFFINFILALSINAQEFKFSLFEINYPDSIEVVKRADWGWVPLTDTIKQQHNIKYLTVHHAGEEFYDQENVMQKIRNLQSWSRREKKWIDIPYHFMMDLEGNIYEARPVNYPGDTNTEYNPFGHVLVEIMGNYEIQEPNEKQIQSLIKFLTFLAQKFEVSAGNIKTHKDYSATTLCPGKNLYKYFEDGSIVALVKENLEEK